MKSAKAREHIITLCEDEETVKLGGEYRVLPDGHVCAAAAQETAPLLPSPSSFVLSEETPMPKTLAVYIYIIIITPSGSNPKP